MTVLIFKFIGGKTNFVYLPLSRLYSLQIGNIILISNKLENKQKFLNTILKEKKGDKPGAQMTLPPESYNKITNLIQSP
jgi:hypothetical protein